MSKLLTHGIRNTKVAIGTNTDGDETWGTPFAVPFAKSISLPITNNDLDIYADDMLQLSIPSDQGYNGNVNYTNRSEELEEKLGYITKEIDGGGFADIKTYGYKKAAFYYETQTTMSDGTAVTAKNWLLNVTIGKPQISSTGDTDSISVEDVQYPLKVIGVAQKTSEGTGIARDEKGFEIMIRRVCKVPGDEGYETFENAVPEPKAKAEPTE